MQFPSLVLSLLLYNLPSLLQCLRLTPQQQQISYAFIPRLFSTPNISAQRPRISHPSRSMKVFSSSSSEVSDASENVPLPTPFAPTNTSHVAPAPPIGSSSTTSKPYSFPVLPPLTRPLYVPHTDHHHIEYPQLYNSLDSSSPPPPPPVRAPFSPQSFSHPPLNPLLTNNPPQPPGPPHPPHVSETSSPLTAAPPPPKLSPISSALSSTLNRKVDWREYRARLLSGGRLRSFERRLTEGSRMLLNSNDNNIPVWVHPLSFVEPGCLLISSPSLHHRRSVLLVLHSNIYTLSALSATSHERSSDNPAKYFSASTTVPSTSSTGGSLSGLLLGEFCCAVGAASNDVPTEMKNCGLYFGGVMGDLRVYFIHKHSSVKGSKELMLGLYIGGDVEDAAKLIREGRAAESDFLFFVQHTFWSSEELSGALQSGEWQPIATSPALVLTGCQLEQQRSKREEGRNPDTSSHESEGGALWEVLQQLLEQG